MTDSAERERLLNASIDITNSTIKDLKDSIKSIEDQGKSIKKSISDLEKSNANVKAYLDSIVPAELARLYAERKNQVRSPNPPK